MLGKMFSTVAAAFFVGAAASEVRNVIIGAGVDMPRLGVGTRTHKDAGAANHAVYKALSSGARFIDTNSVFENHDKIQAGVRDAIAASSVPRKDLFISLTIPGGWEAPGQVEDVVKKSLESLGMEYVDLLLVLPCGIGKACSPTQRQVTWKALENVRERRAAHAIGVSHYCQALLDEHVSDGLSMPSVIRSEWHVGMASDPAGLKFSEDHKIPFQSTVFLRDAPKRGQLPSYVGLVAGIGEKYGKTGQQVSLRWLVQKDKHVIVEGGNEDETAAASEIFDFNLMEEDMAKLDDDKSYPDPGFQFQGCQQRMI